MGEAFQAATVTGAAVKVAKWAWDHQDEVETRLAKLYRSTRRKVFGPSPSVLILGPGGVGKTTLGRILSGKYDFLMDSGGDYEQSVGTQTFRDEKTPDIEVVVAPGQEDRRDSTWPQLLRGLSTGAVRGEEYARKLQGIDAEYERRHDVSRPHRRGDNVGDLMMRVESVRPALLNVTREASGLAEHGDVSDLDRIELRLRLAEVEGLLRALDAK